MNSKSEICNHTAMASLLTEVFGVILKTTGWLPLPGPILLLPLLLFSITISFVIKRFKTRWLNHVSFEINSTFNNTFRITRKIVQAVSHTGARIVTWRISSNLMHRHQTAAGPGIIQLQFKQSIESSDTTSFWKQFNKTNLKRSYDVRIRHWALVGKRGYRGFQRHVLRALRFQRNRP